MPHSKHKLPSPVGRGAGIQTDNPYERISREFDFEQFGEEASEIADLTSPQTLYLPDDSQSVVAKNDSPDITFRYSVNPYRGCAHGCSYCYARPTHEYLGLSAGLDFETKVMVKLRAPHLLRDWLTQPAWRPEPIAFSGVTDCYQPAEKEFRLTRGCLEVALEARQPVNIITKNALVLRDLDLLVAMAEQNLVRVALSITTLDQSLTRIMEPRTSSPNARLATLRELSRAGVSTFLMLAPIVPGLNDSEVPQILKQAHAAGAEGASYVLLRLPSSVREIYFDWLDRHLPDQAEKIKNRIRATRAGRDNSAQFGERMCGTGPIAEQIGRTFQVFASQLGLAAKLPALDCSLFRPPRTQQGQQWMF